MFDPQVARLLAEREKARVTPVSSLSAAQARASRAAWRQVTSGVGPDVHQVLERSVPGPGGSIPARLYLPSPARPLPALVYFHGGGWVLGDLDHSDALCRSLCDQAGCLVVNVDYRLAPEHRYPAAAEDAGAAVRWVAEHASELGADPDRLAVGGASAGGNLAAVAALKARDLGGPVIAAQALIYPITDHRFDTPSYQRFAAGPLVSRDDMRWYWAQYLEREEQGAEPYASPLRTEDLRGLPPALIVTAECDPLCSEGEAYGERLRQAGVPATSARYDGMVHGFLSMPALDKGREAVAFVARWLRERLA
jgi:acetyl esterase